MTTISISSLSISDSPPLPSLQNLEITDIFRFDDLPWDMKELIWKEAGRVKSTSEVWKYKAQQDDRIKQLKVNKEWNEVKRATTTYCITDDMDAEGLLSLFLRDPIKAEEAKELRADVGDNSGLNHEPILSILRCCKKLELLQFIGSSEDPFPEDLARRYILALTNLRELKVLDLVADPITPTLIENPDCVYTHPR